MEMIQDICLTPRDACRLLGEDWCYQPGDERILRVYDGAVTASRRVFDGSEHPLARKGMVVFSSKELDESGKMYLICKYGGFYRPNSKGYTDQIAEAGRYTLSQAIIESYPNGPDGPRDGITYILAPESRG